MERHWVNQRTGQHFWQAAVYPRPDKSLSAASGKQLYTELYPTKEEAERAGYKLCQKIKGRGFVCLKIEAWRWLSSTASLLPVTNAITNDWSNHQLYDLNRSYCGRRNKFGWRLKRQSIKLKLQTRLCPHSSQYPHLKTLFYIYDACRGVLHCQISIRHISSMSFYLPRLAGSIIFLKTGWSGSVKLYIQILNGLNL